MAPYRVGVPRVPPGPPKPSAWAGNWSQVGGVGGDALRVSRKRDDPLRASWHILVPSAEVVREASRQRTGYGM